MLKDIHTQEDLKSLKAGELRLLANEIRETIITTVAQNGGHLSSNLGAVELTMALHRALNLPKDKLIFDVGHQSYTHKLLTGRVDRFHTLRMKDGVGGFLRPDESEYDACISGHASSAISTALGMARARDLKHEDYQVVAVVGDGALTGGMCYEALNDAGQSGTKLIVVLNDNDMSIARNVGALSGYLTGLRQSTPYRRFKHGLTGALDRVPGLGAGVLCFLKKVRDGLKTLLVDDRFFQALGFEYQGPIDGHDVLKLEKVIRRARDARKPTLVHVVTQKGRGYSPAEKHPDEFHGVAPFFVDTGKSQGEKHMGYGNIACGELIKMAEQDSRVCAVTAAMPSGTGLTPFAQKYPKRFFDVGIAEEHALSMAAGLALSGMRPYVGIYSTFLQRAYDQALEDVCIQKLPVTLLIDRAGLTGNDGVTHQGVFDLAYLSQMPGMTVAAPRDAYELKRMLALSLTMDGPMAIRYPRNASDMGAGMQEKGKLRLGQWELLANGTDVMILAVGRMVETALNVSIQLHGRKVSCGVVDARFVKPMDEKMLFSAARRAKLLVTLEEGTIRGGFGSCVLERLAQAGESVPVWTAGVPDRFIEQAGVSEQMRECGLDVDSLCGAIHQKLREVVHGNPQS